MFGHLSSLPYSRPSLIIITINLLLSLVGLIYLWYIDSRRLDEAYALGWLRVQIIYSDTLLTVWLTKAMFRQIRPADNVIILVRTDWQDPSTQFEIETGEIDYYVINLGGFNFARNSGLSRP